MYITFAHKSGTPHWGFELKLNCKKAVIFNEQNALELILSVTASKDDIIESRH